VTQAKRDAEEDCKYQIKFDKPLVSSASSLIHIFDANYLLKSMDSAFTTEEGWNGLCSWEDYPYDAPQHPSNFTCQRTNCTAVKGSKVKYFTDLSPGEGEPCADEDFEAALLKQPLAVAVEASGVS
jgi:hypothetical protein